MYSHCTTGGWILGNTIDGTQAEFVRIPHADTSLYPIPDGADEEALVMLSDILPTGFECGVLNGKVAAGQHRGDRRRRADRPRGAADGAVLFAGRDHHDRSRRQPPGGRASASARRRSSTARDGKAVDAVMEMTGGRGVDTAIEAVGIPATFELCQEIVARGRHHRQHRRARNQGGAAPGADCGIATSPSPRGWSTPSARRCCSRRRAVAQDRPEAADHASLQARRHPRCLRDLRPRRRDARAQGDHRGLANCPCTRHHAALRRPPTSKARSHP